MDRQICQKPIREFWLASKPYKHTYGRPVGPPKVTKKKYGSAGGQPNLSKNQLRERWWTTNPYTPKNNNTGALAGNQTLETGPPHQTYDAGPQPGHHGRSGEGEGGRAGEGEKLLCVVSINNIYTRI